MKNKLKKRIKLIKIIMFVFGFLVFFSLFMGINNADKVKKRKVQQDEERVGSIIPIEFNLRDDDYKIYSGINDKIIYVEKSEHEEEGLTKKYESGNAQTQLQSSTIQEGAYTSGQIYVPEVFSDDESSYNADTNYRDYDESIGENNLLESALQRMNMERMEAAQFKRDNQHIERGRNSGLFVGAHEGGGILTDTGGSGNMLQAMSGHLDSVFNKLGSNQQQVDTYTQQNSQNAKKAFLQEQSLRKSNFELSDKGSFYKENDDIVIIAGSVIPIVMVTGINSDLPGMISARVTEDVYDSLYGTHIIVPKGSMVIGAYDSSLSWGQKRLLVAWSRLSRPDGYSVVLEGMQGTDSQGASGVQGKVKTYMGASIATAVLTSAFGLGVNYSSYYVGKADDTGILSDSTEEAGAGVKNSLKSIAQKLLNRQPTINIKPGTKSFIFVNKDMKLPIFMRK